jgi:DNA-binding response OmpR family regulator
MAPPRILVVEDDPSTLVALSTALEASGYAVERESDGLAALSLAQRTRFDAIISDVNLPGTDGFTLCRRLREQQIFTPIVLLTSRDSDIDEALGLELGADDYVTKPFSLRVLRARLAGLLRRASPAEPDPSDDRFALGPLVIDRARLTVRWYGALIDCTVTELRIIEALATRAGRVLSREKLLELGREDRSFVAPRIVDTYVARLRKKLDAARPASNPIETVVGAGYRYREGG